MLPCAQTRHGLQDAVAAQLGAVDAIDLSGQEGVFANEPDDGEDGPQEDFESQLHAFEIDGAHVSLKSLFTTLPECSAFHCKAWRRVCAGPVRVCRTVSTGTQRMHVPLAV